MIALLDALEPSWVREHWLRMLWDIESAKVAINEDGLWVHYEAATQEDSERILRLLPGALLYSNDSPLGLRPLGAELVSRMAPNVFWSTPASFADVTLPLPSLVINQVEREEQTTDDSIATRLIWSHSQDFREPFGIVCRIEEWLEYSERTPVVQFRHLRFAARADGRVLIIGHPLPSLRGTYLVNTDRLLIPSSWTWFPSVSVASIKRRLNLDEETWLLWLDQSLMELILDESFIAATRSSIRATVATMGAESSA